MYWEKTPTKHKHMHAQLRPPSSYTQDWITCKVFHSFLWFSMRSTPDRSNNHNRPQSSLLEFPCNSPLLTEQRHTHNVAPVSHTRQLHQWNPPWIIAPMEMIFACVCSSSFPSWPAVHIQAFVLVYGLTERQAQSKCILVHVVSSITCFFSSCGALWLHDFFF